MPIRCLRTRDRIASLALSSVATVLLASLSVAGEPAFSFTVMDVFEISGSGYDVVATGQVKSGQITAGQSGCVVSADGATLEIVIVALSKGNKLIDVAETGVILGLGITGATEDQIAVGNAIQDSC